MSLDTKEHLIGLVEHYDLLLKSNHIPELNSFINDERNLCIHHIDKLKAIDMEAMLLAKQSAFSSQSTNLI